eukprot:TRINITY_DN18726_c0_g1_i1.p1 TRINITY_DN18726_c0_g1~~TRINITY_DN18726_c0_g1_i1.p1  ORF type:complete len:113 (-),score=29.19 TRINITY_DN18726_c0_g1_i1:48-386(-)
MTTAPHYYELYRKSTIGVCLTDALDEMIANHTIDAQVALKVLTQFDKSINEQLANKIKMKASFKGHLHTFRLCDDVWTFLLENATFRTESETIPAEKVKIVACDGRTLAPGP